MNKKTEEGIIDELVYNKNGSLTGIKILSDDGKRRYYSHIGDFKEVEDKIYKIRDLIQNDIELGLKVTFHPVDNSAKEILDSRATSVDIQDVKLIKSEKLII